MGRPRMVVSVVIAAWVGLAACSSGTSTDADAPAAREAVAVASFNFPESELLAEIYSQALEASGFPVERHFLLGPRELVVPALVSGLVDVVPEYAGTASQFLTAGRGTASTLEEAVDDLPVQAFAGAPAEDANAF